MEPGDMLKRLAGLSAATVSMQLLKRGYRRVNMRGVTPLLGNARPLCGPAFTLRFIPAREDLSAPAVLGQEGYAPRRAIEEVPEGAVLVIDALGDPETAVIGDLLADRLKVRGCAGVITDGGVRDAEEAAATGLAIYAAGPAAAAHITGLAAGDVNVPIGCGGVAVIPGDIVKADTDGAVIIPRALAADITRDGPEQERYERFAKEKIQGGRSVIGIYPPDEATRQEYDAWCAERDS